MKPLADLLEGRRTIPSRVGLGSMPQCPTSLSEKSTDGELPADAGLIQDPRKLRRVSPASLCQNSCHSTGTLKLKFHGTDTDTDILADFRAEVGVPRRARKSFPVQLATSRTRTTILADLSADLTDTRTFPREDVR